MSRRRFITATALAINLFGCVQTAYQITKAPSSKNVSSQTIDSLQCNEESRINALTGVLFCGVGAAICREVIDSRYEECMKSRGYEIKPMG